LRDKVELVTKCDIVAPIGKHSGARVKYYDTSEAYITGCVENSLSLMATDRIDLLLIHRPDPLMDHAETGARWMRWWPRARCGRSACRTSGPGTGACCNRRWRRRW
jgi:predicted oxidoreductase